MIMRGILPPFLKGGKQVISICMLEEHIMKNTVLIYTAIGLALTGANYLFVAF